MYWARILKAFLSEEERMHGYNKIEDSQNYYAENAKQLQEALIGIIKFV